MKKNKAGKYLKYAVGEIILVVIGILIALSINNWNELRKSNIERNELIVSMISDFALTQTEASNSLLEIKAIMTKNEKLLNALESIPFTKSRKITNDLINSFLVGINFNPNLTAFKAAQANNKLKLLNSNRLLQLLNLYDNFHEDLVIHMQLSAQNFYIGSLYDMRKKVGSISALRTIKSNTNIFGFSDKELIAFLSKKESYAALETTYILNENINRGFTALQRTIRDILTELNKLN